MRVNEFMVGLWHEPSVAATARVGPEVGVSCQWCARALTFSNGRETVRGRKPSSRQPVPSRPGELPSKPSEFHTELLTEPDLILSHLPARAIAGDPIPPLHC